MKTDTKLTLHHMGNFYYLTYQDKISHLEGYIFTIKKIWDVLPIFMQETIYHVRTEMRQSLVQRLNCGTAALQDKEYTVCGIRTAEL